MRNPPSPDAILQTGLGFWASKTLLSAVELGVLTALADGPKTADELCRKLGLQPRALPDCTDALLALGFLKREGHSEQAACRNPLAGPGSAAVAYK
ncbi:methyltransferase dimerization domain-containing protein [uncultured Piscinibacter sp.]|uniref:methyltransferase family protein n=1 Tax=uncultured Piscinibacter sp. TaxID=1131835 RepID=UPI0026085CC0|nr:methyltransferase dimerization domain-containing protein [uncultured Piscinibacter sp.]